MLSYQLEEESSLICLQRGLRVAGLEMPLGVILCVQHGGRRQLFDELKQKSKSVRQIDSVGVQLPRPTSSNM
jgi:hypothetical protein